MRRVVHVLNGPNLDRLGTREPEIYGSTTYPELVALIERRGEDLELDVQVRQTASEGDLVTWIHQADAEASGLLLNAAAYTHTSVAIRDALASVSIPVVEIHISNPHAREEFRRTNLITDVVTATVQGFGIGSYELGLEGLSKLIGDGG